MARRQRNPKYVNLSNRIIEAYTPQSVKDMQNALNDIFRPSFRPRTL